MCLTEIHLQHIVTVDQIVVTIKPSYQGDGSRNGMEIEIDALYRHSYASY